MRQKYIVGCLMATALILSLFSGVASASARPITTTTPTIASAAAFAPQAVSARKHRSKRCSSGTHFNDPRSTRLGRVLANCVRNEINAQPRGATIAIAAYSMDLPMIVNPLIRAHRRGVDVQIILDHHIHKWSIVRRLAAVLNRSSRDESWLKHCVGSCTGPKGRGAMHARQYEFSGTGTSMTGSALLTTASLYKQWNDLTVIRGDRALFRKLHWYFLQMRKDRYVKPSSFTHRGRTWLMFPKATSPRGDYIQRLLNQVHCPKRGTKTIVRVAISAMGGGVGHRIAKRLAQLDHAGCDVRVLGGEAISSSLKRFFKRQRVLVQWRNSAAADYVHTKMVTIKGWIGKARLACRTSSGSANWSDVLPRRDEVITVSPSCDTYGRYRRWHYNIWESGY